MHTRSRKLCGPEAFSRSLTTRPDSPGEEMCPTGSNWSPAVARGTRLDR
jgi:hypothetical protein